jgi:hypothetical protein
VDAASLSSHGWQHNFRVPRPPFAPLCNKLGCPSFCIERCLAAWRASALLKFNSIPAIPQATQFPSLELIGWNIKAAGQQTPPLAVIPTLTTNDRMPPSRTAYPLSLRSKIDIYFHKLIGGISWIYRVTLTSKLHRLTHHRWEHKMTEKGKKLQLAVPKRSYEKPVLILLNTGDTLGKKPYSFEDPGSFTSPSGPS